MHSNVYLTALSYELGDLAPMTRIDELRSDSAVLETFSALGLRRYARSDLEPYELARDSARRTLELWGKDASDIDAIIYATNTFGDLRHHRDDLRRLCCALGTDRAYVAGVFGWECSNLYVALQSAMDRLALGRASHVLVISTDKGLPGESRVLPPNLSLLSDGACSCIVTNVLPERGGFSVLSSHSWSDPRLWEFGQPSDIAEFYRSVEGVKHTAASALQAAAVAPREVDVMVTNNYNASIMRTYALQAEVALDKVFFGNLARFAHAYAADPLINIADVAATGFSRSGACCLLVFSGPVSWGAAVLRQL